MRFLLGVHTTFTIFLYAFVYPSTHTNVDFLPSILIINF